ncbi:MAG: Stp1/IreP family PP2C-type Ser/Thr phosphatase [Clostridia bacterium]|nr:Stp1/IreP family PP2C-type Ser/Thr phosphatase [Clostridia bacterium]
MYYGKTDKGRVRKENQDNFGCFEAADCTCLIVCDGMGGAKGGSVASDICVKKVSAVLKEKINADMTEQDIIRAMNAAVESANDDVFVLSHNDETLHGMGTTLVLAVIRGNRLFYTHLGDSRLYAVDESGIKRLTKDHSYVQEMVDIGKITAKEAENHPNKNIITNAIGIMINAENEVIAENLNGKRLLLCSDGLSNMLDDGKLLEIIYKYGITEKCVDVLIEKANKKGGNDNITAVIYGG